MRSCSAGAPSGSPRSGSRATACRRSAAARRPASPPRDGGGSRARRPMFCGSSCAHTSSSRYGYAGESSAGLDAGTDRAARPARRRRARRRPYAPRGRRCRSRACRSRARGGGPPPGRRAGRRGRGWNAAVREVVERRGRLLEAQQPLGRHHDERARRRVERLPAQEVEVLRRGGAVRDADVLLRGELEEALEPRARVLGAVALVAVREQQRQP